MNCIFCQNPLDLNKNGLCIKDNACRSYGVHHVVTTHLSGEPIGPILHLIQFTGSVNGRTYLITYHMENSVYGHAGCQVAEQITPPFDPEDESVSVRYSYQSVMRLPFPPFSLTPHNFRDKLPVLLTFS